MTDEDLLDHLEAGMAMLRVQWFSLGKAIHQRDWGEVEEVFRRMGVKLGESVDHIDWTLEESSEGG